MFASAGRFWGGILLTLGVIAGLWIAGAINFKAPSPILPDGYTNPGINRPANPPANPPANNGGNSGGNAAPANTGMWGPAGPAPTSFSGTPMYMPDGSGTIIGWVVPGATSNLPAGVCIDYDPRQDTGSWISGSYTEIFKAATSRRVRLTSDGSYNGPYPATIYWTPC